MASKGFYTTMRSLLSSNGKHLINTGRELMKNKDELDIKIIELIDFMRGDNYAQLAPTHQGLLMVNLVAMQGYSESLSRLIDFEIK